MTTLDRMATTTPLRRPAHRLSETLQWVLALTLFILGVVGWVALVNLGHSL